MIDVAGLGMIVLIPANVANARRMGEVFDFVAVAVETL